MASVLTDEQIAQLLPLKDLAHQVPESRRTLHHWRTVGRMNAHKTKIVYLRCVWLPLGGWGSCKQFYNDFIRELQEV